MPAVGIPVIRFAARSTAFFSGLFLPVASSGMIVGIFSSFFLGLSGLLGASFFA